MRKKYEDLVSENKKKEAEKLKERAESTPKNENQNRRGSKDNLELDFKGIDEDKLRAFLDVLLIIKQLLRKTNRIFLCDFRNLLFLKSKMIVL